MYNCANVRLYYQPSEVKSPLILASTCRSVPLSYKIISWRLCTLNSKPGCPPSTLVNVSSSVTLSFSFNASMFSRKSRTSHSSGKSERILSHRKRGAHARKSLIFFCSSSASASNKLGLAATILSKFASGKTVSYTHLTLPTIYSV